MKILRTIHAVGQGAFYTEKIKINEQYYNVVYDCGTDSGKNIIETEIEGTFDKGEKINAVFISHFHTDHTNGLEKLLSYCDVNYLFLPVITLDKLALLESDENSYFIKQLVLNPERVVDEISPNTSVVHVLGEGDEYYNSEMVARDYDWIDLSENYRDGRHLTVRSGTKILLFRGMWEYIPYNLPDEELKRKIRKDFSDEKIDPESIQKENFYKARKIFNKHIPSGRRNVNSLVVYSGTSNDDFKRFVWNRRRFVDVYLWNQWNRAILYSGCLYLGDFKLDQHSIDLLYRKYREYTQNIGIIQVPHHGSKHNFHKDVFRAFRNSELYFISAGTRNKYKHPHTKVLQAIHINHRMPLVVNEGLPLILDGEL